MRTEKASTKRQQWQQWGFNPQAENNNEIVRGNANPSVLGCDTAHKSAWPQIYYIKHFKSCLKKSSR